MAVLPLQDVPIIGQPFTAHEAVVFVTMTCHCQPDNGPILVQGIGVAAVCARCRKRYAILRVAFDRERGDRVVHAQIACLTPVSAPTPEGVQ
jgi:hypothetical protein